jgi:hypothetical protein
MMALSPQQLQAAVTASVGAITGFGGALLLALLSAAVETLVTRRAHGRRRRLGALLLTAALADALKLLSKSTVSRGPWHALGVLVALLPAVVIAGGLPAGGGLGVLPATVTLDARFFGLSAVLAMAPFALIAHGLTTTPTRRRPTAEVVICLVGAQTALVLCVTALVLAGDVADFFARPLADWPLWRHPAGGLAFLGALAILTRGLRHAFGDEGPGRLAPGLAEGPGVGIVLLRMSRPLLIGSASAMAVHLYLGAAPLPPGVIWAGIAVWIALVFLLQAAITDVDVLPRLVWGRVVPLATIDVAWSLLRVSGVTPWS